MSFKRKAVRLLESALNVRILRPSAVGLVFEQVHLERFLKTFSVDCVLDIGANRGQYASMLRSRANYSGLIVSYEPVPAALAHLKAAASRDPSWIVVDSALDRTPGRRRMNIMKREQFSSLLLPSTEEVVELSYANEVESHIEVEVRSLSEEFQRLRDEYRFRIPFLKMDTQGNDLAVAQGGQDVLRNFVGIQTELAIKRLYGESARFCDSLEFFRDQGFDLSALVPNNQGHFPQLIEIDGIFVRRDLIGSCAPSI